MIGAIVGDIVGSRFEFNNYRAKDFQLFNEDCFATDDSIMTLAIAQAIMDSKEYGVDLYDSAEYSMREIGQPYPYCGFGGRFFEWMYSTDPKPYNSFGNGAAMRISSVAYFSNFLEDVRYISNEVTRVTHNHPEGIKGAEATAICTWLALNGESKKNLREYATRYYPLNFSIDEIREDYRFNETCQMTVPQAIVCFLESTDFEDAIRIAVSLGGDSDTLACITGSIAGAFYGVPTDIEDQALTYLDRRLLSIYERFTQNIHCF